MRLGLIPARGGSKRILGKNIKNFCGKPIIAYSIETALASNCFDQLIVSTDDEAIAKVAKEYGAKVPFMRPENIADDHATTMDVIAHGLDWYERQGKLVTDICCIYATAPFLQAEDLRSVQTLMDTDKPAYVFAATSYAFPIQRAFYKNDAQRVEMFHPEHEKSRSQDLVEAYHDAGQFYWCSQEAIKKRLPIFAPHSMPYIMDRSRVQDIDTPEDWHFAEALYKILGDKS